MQSDIIPRLSGDRAPPERGSDPASTALLLQAASHTPQQPPVGHLQTGGCLEAAQHPNPRTGVRVLQEGSATALREWINFIITSHTACLSTTQLQCD